MGEILLRAENIDKHFGITHALDNVSFTFNKGEIHALIGENGSVFFIPEDKKGSAMIVIESSYYKGKIKTTCFSSPGNGAGIHTVFKPE